MFSHEADNGKALISVLNGTEPWRRPMWFMRQAGRYLPEYRECRKQAGSFLNLCYNPELAAEVTLQPLRRFDLDAAIIFADILLIPQALGVKLEFETNKGPVLQKTGSEGDVARLDPELTGEDIDKIYETIRLVAAQLPAHVALIGFCGAPWTVATYMIEGGTSTDRPNARKAAFDGAPWFDQLIALLEQSSIEYLVGQVKAGAEVLQIFDTWAGDLPEWLREKYCIGPIRRIVEGVRGKVGDIPMIGFARGFGVSQGKFASDAGVSAIGLETGIPVRWMSAVAEKHVPVQGNLDPIALIAGGEGLKQGVECLVQGMPMDRHIFNLGHGIRPETPTEHVSFVVDHVRKLDRAG